MESEGAPPHPESDDRPTPRLRRWHPALALALTALLLFVGLQVWWVLRPGPALLTGPRIVEIPAHRGFLEVARLLDRAGAIRSPVGFILLTIGKGSVRSLKAGEYQLPQGATTLTVLSMIESGQVLQHPVVLREG